MKVGIYSKPELFKIIKSKGYGISVDGGWILKDKEIEMKLGIIDE